MESTAQERYLDKKAKLLNDESINSNNREVMEKFLDFQEHRLKRRVGLADIDAKNCKTLRFNISRLRNINRWFNNKDWTKLDAEEIKKLIDDLEDGNIKTQKGTRYSDRSLYYQMLQGKLFDLVGKSQIVREFTAEFSIKGREFTNNVRFINEEDFRKIVDCAITPEQRCLLWLGFDIGENIGSLLLLKKDDFKKQANPDTNEPEYLVYLDKDNLKRSRTARSEITNYRETVQYLDIVLNNLKPIDKAFSNKSVKKINLGEIHSDDKLFKFGLKNAQKFLKRVVEKAGVKCLPKGQIVTWKDLRSSMACDLLRKGWSCDEINARLGHTPSSRMIDKYITYLALDRHKPKQKVYDSNLKRIEIELEKQKDINKLQGLRVEKLQESAKEIELIKQKLRIIDSMIKVDDLVNMENIQWKEESLPIAKRKN